MAAQSPECETPSAGAALVRLALTTPNAVERLFIGPAEVVHDVAVKRGGHCLDRIESRVVGIEIAGRLTIDVADQG